MSRRKNQSSDGVAQQEAGTRMSCAKQGYWQAAHHHVLPSLPKQQVAGQEETPGGFRFDTRKNFLTERFFKHLRRLPRDVVESLFLEVLKDVWM